MQERIKDISEYFRGFEFVQNLLIIKVQYKDKWDVFGTKDESIKVAPDDKDKNVYFYYGENTIEYDAFFNLIETTIRYNMEKEEKVALLREKMNELKELFLNENMETLKTLKFTFEKKKEYKKRGRKPKQQKVDEQSPVMEAEEVKQEQEIPIMENKETEVAEIIPTEIVEEEVNE